MESFQQNISREKYENELSGQIDVPDINRPYKKGDRVSVVRSDGSVEGTWVLSQINNNSVTAIKEINGKIKEKEMSIDEFVSIQQQEGDKRTHAVNFGDEEVKSMNKLQNDIRIREEVSKVESVPITNLQEAENYLNQYDKDNVNYQAVWEAEYDKLKKKIHELRENNLDFSLIAAKMRKMNEAKRFILPE